MDRKALNDMGGNADLYIDEQGYAIMHLKCGRDMRLKSSLGRIPYCEGCGCYVTDRADYKRYEKGRMDS